MLSRCISLALLLCLACPPLVNLHAVPTYRAPRGREPSLRLVPSEAIVAPGETVTFECRTPDNATLSWEAPWVRQYEVARGVAGDLFFSRITIRGAHKSMNGEIACLADGGRERLFAVLVVDEAKGGVWTCETSEDCATESATCMSGVCECPLDHVRLRVKEGDRDICRQMIYSLYDPCEYDEQCSHMVDPKSVCKSVCVCAPWARDRRGKCVAVSELSSSRSQEMYRVGLIAVTCVIILIVAVSLWVTLKKSCRDGSYGRSIRQGEPSRPSIDGAMDKPPSYDDVLVTTMAQNITASPPNFKEALKNCMTARQLLRQVSAPAGEMLQRRDAPPCPKKPTIPECAGE